MTTQTLSGIPRDSSTSMGGIVEALIAGYDDVTGVTVKDEQISAITTATAAKFKRYCFRKGTGSMTSTLNVDAVTFPQNSLSSSPGWKRPRGLR